MKPRQRIFFAPWFKDHERGWLTLCSIGIVICTAMISPWASRNAFYFFGAEGHENVLVAGLELLSFFVILGSISGMRFLEACCIGCCAALSQAGIQYGVHFQAGGLMFLSITVPGLGILWLLGHHPPKRS